MYTPAAATASRDSRVDDLATRLLNKRGEHLLHIARHNSATRDDAEEALQEAFIAFLTSFDPDGEAPPLPWLIVTLKRECWARGRKSSRERLMPPCGDAEGTSGLAVAVLMDPGRGPAQFAELTERVVDVRHGLEQLKPDHRRCLSLKALGYSYEEIGEMTGWTYTKVNRCMVEGRARLRQISS